MHRSRFILGRLLCYLVLATSAAVASDLAVEGAVHDSGGKGVDSALVTLKSGTFTASTRTDADGVFSFHGVEQRSGSIDVSAPGFVPIQRSWESDSDRSVHLDITLQPSPSKEVVTVSAARTDMPLSDTPGSAILLSATDMLAAPALRIDDVLRQVPGFSLFRRSGSRTANASAQGVSLRGLGGSATSRALVIFDGIPLVDPFGGWVYWDRIPRVAISSVEVYRGGASNLYGSSALGGVVQVFSPVPDPPAISLETSYGDENTPDLSFLTGQRLRRWDYSVTSEMFRTDGYIPVPDSVRGSVDRTANSRDVTVYTRIGHTLGDDGRVFARGNFYSEDRNNGTQLQTNDTRIGEGMIGLDKRFRGNDSLMFRLYGDVESYNQTFTAVAPDRNSETLTDIQHVPVQVVGAAGQYQHPWGSSHTLLGGADVSEVIGASDEVLLTGPNQQRIGGGRQRTLGFFGEDIFRRRKWTAILAARVDDWTNFRGRLETVPVSGTPVTTIYPDRTEVALSPRVSLLRSLNEHVSLTGSVYRAFRAPTLNELYRTFRVGNVLTTNNAALHAERLTGAEAGANISNWGGRLNVRGTFFWSDIVDPVANVTLSATPTLITRQKMNLGRTRSRGVELDGILRVNRDFQISAGYSYTAATVISYPGSPGGVDLVGLDVPQVPRNVFTWQARYWNPDRVFLSVTGRMIGRQFDDDQNQLPLASFYSMDLQVGRTLTSHLEVFGAMENVLNQRYEVARTPVTSLGPPILFRIGLRINYPRK